MAATADSLARSAQLRAHQVRAPRAPLPSARGAALLLSSVAHGGTGAVAQAVLLRQLSNTAAALYGAHKAAGEAQRAREILLVGKRELAMVQAALMPPTPKPALAAEHSPIPERGWIPRPPKRCGWHARLSCRCANQVHRYRTGWTPSHHVLAPSRAAAGTTTTAGTDNARRRRQGEQVMAEESDGVDGAVEGVLRVGLTAAGRVAEVIARAREQAAREARAVSEHEARELAERLTAERSAARAQLAPVHRGDWWDHAQPAAVATAWETARAWQQVDPDAARAADRIRDEVRTRYGVDVDAPGGDPTAVHDALQRRGLALEDATDQRSTAALEQVEAARLLAEADRIDRVQDTEAEPERSSGEEDLYDTVERRQELAASLEGVASSEAIEARAVECSGRH